MKLSTIASLYIIDPSLICSGNTRLRRLHTVPAQLDCNITVQYTMQSKQNVTVIASGRIDNSASRCDNTK